MKNKKYNIHGVDCPNCAMKIEKAISSDTNFMQVNFDFTTSKLTLSTNLDDTSCMDRIQKILDNNEPCSKITKLNHNFNNKKYKNKSLFLFASLILLIVYFILKIIFQDIKIILLLPILIYFLSGFEVYIKFFKNIKNLNFFDENFLMIIATICAIIIGQFTEACFVMLFYSLGENLQDIAVKNSRKSIKKAIKLRPEKSNLLVNGNITEISPDKLKPNDIILIKPGERVPIDCIVIKGSSLIDTKTMTGESLPLNASKGTKLLSGCINQNSTLTAKVISKYENSAVAKMLEIIENVSTKKANTENFITKFAKIYTPIVVILAILIFLVPVFIFSKNLNTWAYRSLIFIVSSCPCAFILSVPLSYFAGISTASTKGILIKGGIILEKLSNIQTIIFDKTGTLTNGTFEIIDQKLSVDEKTFYNSLFIAEYGSNHPIARAILKKTDIKFNSNITNTWIHEEISGKGIIAKNNKETIYVGKKELLIENNISVPTLSTPYTVIHIARNRIYLGYILIGDTLRNDAKESIKDIKNLGIKNISILTGDRKEVADKVAKELAIDKIEYELLPEEKYKSLLKKGKNTLYIGDGINDVPVILTSDVGVALGGIGQDTIIEASDVVLTNDKLSSIPIMLKIGRKTKKIVIENISFTLVTKLLVLLFGLFGYSTLWMAIFADVGVSILTIINALRILRVK